MDRPVVGFLGDIRYYKGLDLLLAAVGHVQPGEITTFIAGTFQDQDYGTTVREAIFELRDQGQSIVMVEERLGSQRLADAVRACDLVVLPYREIWNSGLALLILENRGRILTSDAAVFQEMQGELGPEWVQIFEATPTGEDLTAALLREPGHLERIEAYCSARTWAGIAAETKAFYERLLSR
jgi:hypothetical protein